MRLPEIRLHDSLSLYLVTSLSEDAAELYRHRGDAEIDIRNFQVVPKAETMRVRSVEMFHKELWMSLVAYNLVSNFRRIINAPNRHNSKNAYRKMPYPNAKSKVSAIGRAPRRSFAW